jgi:hypothetical protein
MRLPYELVVIDNSQIEARRADDKIFVREAVGWSLEYLPSEAITRNVRSLKIAAQQL